MLQDVYDWAGRDRWVDTGRDAAPFCFAAFIGPELRKRFAAINAEDNLYALSAS
jgi:fido (protein-threonine AMPylation protein)